jgi:hypothetical protein
MAGTDGAGSMKGHHVRLGSLGGVLLIALLAPNSGCRLEGEGRPEGPVDRLPTAPGPWLPGQADRDPD